MKNEEKISEEKTSNKPDIKKAPMNKAVAYILATLVCVAIYFIYIVITVTVFKWEAGGGTLPFFILLSILVVLWKWIISRLRHNC